MCLKSWLGGKLDGDGAEGSEVEVVTLSLNNPLRVTSTNGPRHGTRTPRAIPVEVTNELIALDRVDDVVSARRTGWRVRVTAGIDQYPLSFGDDVVLVLRRRNLYVLVACGGNSVSTNLTSFPGEVLTVCVQLALRDNHVLDLDVLVA